MSDLDWLKKKPGNPIHFNIRRSTHRLQLASPDMNASLMTNPDQNNTVLPELPRRKLKPNIQPIGLNENDLKIMFKSDPQRKQLPRPSTAFRTTMHPANFASSKARQSLAPNRACPSSTRCSPRRRSTYFGLQKNIPTKKNNATMKLSHMTTPVVVQTKRKDESIRSILKQSQDKVSRLPLPASARAPVASVPKKRQSFVKPQAMKRVNFGQQKENEEETEEDTLVGIHVLKKESPVSTVTSVISATTQTVALAAVQLKLRPDVHDICSIYRARMINLWEEFFKELTANVPVGINASTSTDTEHNMGVAGAGLGDEEAVTTNKTKKKVVIRGTPPSTSHITSNNLSVVDEGSEYDVGGVAMNQDTITRRSPRAVRPPLKFMFEDDNSNSCKDSLRKVSDKGKYIKKKKDEGVKRVTKKKVELSKAYKDLQKSMNLDSTDFDSDGDCSTSGDTPVNTPARRRQMSRRVRRGLTRIMCS